MTTKKSTNIDWDLVEVHYRAGIRSLKDIGSEFRVSDAGILKRAKRDGWTRDLSARIRAKADAKVSAAAVSAEVSAERAANERAVVEANAEVQYRVRMEQRADIARTRALFGKLLAEIEAVTEWSDAQELVRQMHEVVNGGEDGKRASRSAEDMLQRVLSGPGRIDSAKKLVETLEKLVRMEREAHGIDASKPAAGGIEEFLAGLCP